MSWTDDACSQHQNAASTLLGLSTKSSNSVAKSNTTKILNWQGFKKKTPVRRVSSTAFDKRKCQREESTTRVLQKTDRVWKSERPIELKQLHQTGNTIGSHFKKTSAHIFRSFMSGALDALQIRNPWHLFIELTRVYLSAQ